MVLSFGISASADVSTEVNLAKRESPGRWAIRSVSNCPKTISARQAEAQAWEKVYQFNINPDYLLAQVDAKVFRLQKEELRLHEELKRLNDERQEFITKARKERMSAEEFTPRIGALYEKERGVQRRLTTIERTKDDFTKLDLEEQVKKYVAELQSGMTELVNADPQTPEERHQVFLLKKRIVDTALEEARINADREIHIKFRSNFTISPG